MTGPGGVRSHPGKPDLERGATDGSEAAPASPATAAVTICICTKGRPEDLARTLASLGRSNYPVAQVVVSDDGHDDRTAAVCRDAGVEVDYRLGPQRGLGANRNAALDACTGEYILFLDDDCLLGRNFLQEAIACARSAEERHGAGRVMVSGRELNLGQLIRAHDQTFLGFQAKPYRNGECLRSIVINATLFPAGVFSYVQFDQELVYGYEEVDFAGRAVAAGYFIINCDPAINDHRPSPRGREAYERYIDASRLRVTLRRYAVTERDPFRALAFAVVAPLHVVAADVKRLGLRAGLRRTALTLGLSARMLWCAPPRAGGAVAESATAHGRHRYALSLADLAQGMTVVDWGCADGGFASHLSRWHLASRVVACDIPYPAPPRSSEATFEYHVVDERSPRLPLPDHTVDRVFMLDVLEHMGRVSRNAAVTEIGRVLKPSGRLIVTVPHRGWLHWADVENIRMRFPMIHRAAFVLVRGRRAYRERYGANRLVNFSSDANAHHHYSERELVAVLRAAGFSPGAPVFFGVLYIVPWGMLVLLEGLRRLTGRRWDRLERLTWLVRKATSDARPAPSLAESLAIVASPSTSTGAVRVHESGSHG